MDVKLVWKGRYKDASQLEKGVLPENAVKFKEPDTPAKVNFFAALYIIPVFIFAAALALIKNSIAGYSVITSFSYTGFAVAFLTIVPHELLHAVCFPKEAKVFVYYSIKNLMVFITSVCPVSKSRFIFLSLCPSLVFGIVPLAVWLFYPSASYMTDALFFFGISSLLLGLGDFMNIKNAFFQMPRGSLTQLSGFNSYWFMPQSPEEPKTKEKETALH